MLIMEPVMQARLMQVFVLILTVLIGQVVLAETIPTRLFFQDAQIRNMKISPDGKHVAFNYEDGSEVKLAVMNLADQRITAAFGLGDNQHVFNLAPPQNSWV
jgi:hypothetical protein